jgi:hypothetical protein
LGDSRLPEKFNVEAKSVGALRMRETDPDARSCAGEHRPEPSHTQRTERGGEISIERAVTKQKTQPGERAGETTEVDALRSDEEQENGA